MFECAPGCLFVSRADEVNIKKIFPRFALQRAGFDLCQVDIAQGEHTQCFEQRARLILQREDNGRFGLSLRYNRLVLNGKEARLIFRVILNPFFENLHSMQLGRAA